MRQAKRRGYKNNSQRGFYRELFALIHIIGPAEWSPDTEELAVLSAEIVNQILVDILWGLSEPIGLGWLNSFVRRTAAGDYYFHYLQMCYFGASSIKCCNWEKKALSWSWKSSWNAFFRSTKSQKPRDIQFIMTQNRYSSCIAGAGTTSASFWQTMMQITSLSASIQIDLNRGKYEPINLHRDVHYIYKLKLKPQSVA